MGCSNCVTKSRVGISTGDMLSFGVSVGKAGMGQQGVRPGGYGSPACEHSRLYSHTQESAPHFQLPLTPRYIHCTESS